MDEIALVGGEELGDVIEALSLITRYPNRVYALRFCVDDGQLKIKVNDGPWTRGLGQLDPACEAARYRERRAGERVSW